jgi:hypothetical protein
VTDTMNHPTPSDHPEEVNVTMPKARVEELRAKSAVEAAAAVRAIVLNSSCTCGTVDKNAR